MTYNRRKFLSFGSALLAGLPLSRALAGPALHGTYNPIGEFGLQLWTVKDALNTDVPGTFKQLSAFGYKQIEGFEGPKGLFWGMTNKEFKKSMDDLGMSFISSHCNINQGFEGKAAQAAEIGMKYLICPYVGPQKTMDDYKKVAEKFNASGEICKKNGLRFAYHNHGYTFQAVDGKFPHDLLMENTDPNLVDYEMDIYWVVQPGQDPIAWFNKYPNRFRLCHVKDRKKEATAKDIDASCNLGTGSIDFSKILNVAAKNGMQYYIVEQEKFENSTSMKSSEANAGYMKTLSI